MKGGASLTKDERIQNALTGNFINRRTPDTRTGGKMKRTAKRKNKRKNKTKSITQIKIRKKCLHP